MWEEPRWNELAGTWASRCLGPDGVSKGSLVLYPDGFMVARVPAGKTLADLHEIEALMRDSAQLRTSSKRATSEGE